MKILDYNLTRSKRKTIAIVIKEGNVVIKAPLKTQTSYIETFVLSKQNWINSKLDAYKALNAENDRFINYDYFSFFGIDCKPQITSSVKSTTLDKDNRLLLIPIKYALTGDEKFLTIIKKFYRKTAYKYLLDKLMLFKDKFGFDFNSFAITNARTKWGSCSSKNDIRLNFRLIMLDEKFIDYVVIHELCHTIEHNHSKQFWLNVQNYFPNYKAVRCDLKAKNIFIKLF